MADNDQSNDEYEFVDLDTINSDSVDELGETVEDAEAKSESTLITDLKQNPVIRNSVIVVVIVIVLLILYKIIASFYTDKDVPKKPLVTAKIKEFHPPQVKKMQPIPVVIPPTVALEESVKQKLTVLEENQQSTKNSLTNVNDKLSGISTNLDSLMAKITELNSTIANLNTKIDVQAHELDQLAIKHEETRKIVQRKVIKGNSLLKYNIQAIIPGRAWLIAKNGSTLTVREGTDISGYGTVKLIDPNQGRVLTSSGAVIKFSQDDS